MTQRLSAKLRVPPQAARRARELVGGLMSLDGLGLTQFEFSIKFAQGKPRPVFRFLNIDADGYACARSKLFLSRLEAVSSLIARSEWRPQYAPALGALAALSRTPVDLYFGADLGARGAEHAFWLIFGGVDKTGRAKFCPYDAQRLSARTFERLGFATPAMSEGILNLGVDLLPGGLRLKLYYLCDGKLEARSFSEIGRALDVELGGFRHFRFFSEMYEPGGALVKEKLFVEFLDDVELGGPRAARLWHALERGGWLARGGGALFEGLDGRASLLSFETDGALTAYLRP